METSSAELPELGFYGLAGHTNSPRDLLAECRDAERLGLGSVFLSERHDLKEAATICGAAAAITDTLGIATSVTNHNTRHVMVTAAHGSTMHKLSGGRYALGLGRGFDRRAAAWNMPRTTMAQMEDTVGLLRRLWKGEAIVDHAGPSGSYPMLRQSPNFDFEIPIMLAALGENTMRWAGGVFDGVMLHTFFTDEALARCVAAVREGAAAAGKDPSRVRVWAVLATMCDLPEDKKLPYLVGRMATYLQAYGDTLVTINRWDRRVLEAFREHPDIKGRLTSVDSVNDPVELARIGEAIPQEWLAPSAIGSAEACARRISDQFAAGADGVILHCSTPEELAPVLDAYRLVRDDGRFADRSRNPGL